MFIKCKSKDFILVAGEPILDGHGVFVHPAGVQSVPGQHRVHKLEHLLVGEGHRGLLQVRVLGVVGVQQIFNPDLELVELGLVVTHLVLQPLHAQAILFALSLDALELLLCRHVQVILRRAILPVTGEMGLLVGALLTIREGQRVSAILIQADNRVDGQDYLAVAIYLLKGVWEPRIAEMVECVGYCGAVANSDGGEAAGDDLKAKLADDDLEYPRLGLGWAFLPAIVLLWAFLGHQDHSLNHSLDLLFVLSSKLNFLLRVLGGLNKLCVELPLLLFPLSQPLEQEFLHAHGNVGHQIFLCGF